MSLGLALSCLACSKYDDSALYNLIAKLDQRLVAVEEHVKKANENIKTLKSLVSAASQGKTITEVKKTDEGYDLTFSDKQVISIKMGRDGMDGHSPKISVALDGGVYYWQLDGKWLLDTQGQKVRVSGETGPQGIPGKDGATGPQGIPGLDGKTPKLRINAGKWEVAYGNNDWTPVTVVSSGTSGATSVEGLDLFKNIKETDQEVVITLKSGGTIKLSKQTSTPSNSLQPGEVISNPNNPFNGKNIVWDEISSDDCELSADGLTLVKLWNNKIKNFDMNRDPLLRKIKVIGSSALKNCRSLTSINISSSVTTIGGYAFENCSSLTSIHIPNSVTRIWGNAFANCSSLTSIHIPNSVTRIEKDVFASCTELTSIDIPNSVKSIGEEAFKGCSNLTDINIPSSVASIGESAFTFCRNLTSINIPNSVTNIGNNAFSGCSSLTSITIPSSVTSIEEWAFSGCSSLTRITIPSSVTSIGGSAFSGCSSLTSITIPSSVTSIKEWAFYDCSNLTSMVFKGNNPPKLDDDQVFAGTLSSLKLIVPKGAKSAYIKAGYPEDKLVEQ